MAKVIIAGLTQTATAAAKGKGAKPATHPVMGALKGLIDQTLEQFQPVEKNVDDVGEHLENMQFALGSENWQVTGEGAKAATSALKELQRAQKSAAKAVANMNKLAAKAEAAITKARIQEQAESEEQEDGDEEE